MKTLEKPKRRRCECAKNATRKQAYSIRKPWTTPADLPQAAAAAGADGRLCRGGAAGGVGGGDPLGAGVGGDRRRIRRSARPRGGSDDAAGVRGRDGAGGGEGGEPVRAAHGHHPHPRPAPRSCGAASPPSPKCASAIASQWRINNERPRAKPKPRIRYGAWVALASVACSGDHSSCRRIRPYWE